MLRQVEENKTNKWFRLDNAAKIYPAANTRRWSGMFRLSISLKEKVNPDILQTALEKTIVRFPSFNIRMRRGFFWYYFDSNEKRKPRLRKDVNNPCLPIGWNDDEGFLLRVYYYEKRIAIDYFHSLTDGTGAMVFLKTLTAQYLKQMGKDVSYTDGVLDVTQEADEREFEDAFMKFADSKVKSRVKEEKAYHIKGTKLSHGDISIITGVIPLESIKELAKKNKATITEYLAALLLYSYYQEKLREGLYKKPSHISISIPLNLRNFFDSPTNRNFSLYLNPSIDTMMGEFTLEEIILQIQYFMKSNLNKKTLNAMMTQNVKIEKNIFIRIAPLFIKKLMMSIAHKIFAYRPITASISNIGIVKLPKDMEEYVERIEFLLGAAKNRTPNMAVVSYQDTLVINITSMIEEREIERFFFTHLIKEGVPVKIESNRE